MIPTIKSESDPIWRTISVGECIPADESVLTYLRFGAIFKLSILVWSDHRAKQCAQCLPVKRINQLSSAWGVKGSR